jgi:hypothetical protein
MGTDTTGLTADGTWQFGVRRTFPLRVDEAWALVHEHEDLWLGGGTITSVTHGEVARAKQPDGSIVQLRVLPGKRGTAIAFHHEKLEGPQDREASARRFNAVLDALEAHAGR